MEKKQFNTHSHIISVLVEMMKTTAIDNIKIVDLCKKAGISRVTFYNHFYDRYDVATCFCKQIFEKVYHTDFVGYDLFTSCCLMNHEHIKNAVFFKNFFKSDVFNVIHFEGINILEKALVRMLKAYTKKPLSEEQIFQCRHSAIFIVISTREWTIADFPITPEKLAEFQCNMVPDIIQKAHSHKIPQRNGILQKQ